MISGKGVISLASNPMVTLTCQSLLSQVVAGSLSRRYRQGRNRHYKRSRLLVPAVNLKWIKTSGLYESGSD